MGVSKGSILVTGGGGYIGRHGVRPPGGGARKGIAPDNFGRGFPQGGPPGETILGGGGGLGPGPGALGGARGRTGMAFWRATTLTKVACEAMVGKRPHVSVFGSDYPTPDGTGMRDYLHVEDLAAAHLNALDYLRNDGKSVTLNVGYGHGYSVREVLRMVESVGGKPLVIREEARRAGDPAYLVARADRIRAELGWQPRYDDLQAIVSHSLAWERKLLQEPWS